MGNQAGNTLALLIVDLIPKKEMTKEAPNIQSFIKNLERQFDDPSSEFLTPATLFRNLPRWNSLQSLVVILSFDEEYGVSISSDELHRAQTVEDLYNLVKVKQGV